MPLLKAKQAVERIRGEAFGQEDLPTCRDDDPNASPYSLNSYSLFTTTMKRFLSNVLIAQLRQAIATTLLGIIVLVGIVFCSDVSEAIAKPLTPEAQSYQIDRNSQDFGSAKNTADDVRDTLNLDQPLYPGTNGFTTGVKERIETAIDNTKSAFGGVVDDAKDIVDNSFEKVH